MDGSAEASRRSLLASESSHRRESQAFEDVVQNDAINEALGKKDKEGSERITDVPRWCVLKRQGSARLIAVHSVAAHSAAHKNSLRSFSRNFRVDGRKFSKWSQISKRKPRRTLLYLPVADPWYVRSTLYIGARAGSSTLATLATLATPHPHLFAHAPASSRFAAVVSTTNTLTDMIYTSYFVALSMAFNDYSRINAWTIIDLIGSSIYVLDIIAEFHIGGY